MSTEAPKTVTINGKEFDLADLSETVKKQLASLQMADQELTRLQRLVAMTQTARNAYANAINEELTKVEK